MPDFIVRLFPKHNRYYVCMKKECPLAIVAQIRMITVKPAKRTPHRNRSSFQGSAELLYPPLS